jgi:hypothetical protein
MIHDLEGKLTVKLRSQVNMNDFCAKRIPGYDPERFDVVAVRVFAGAEFIVTIYAADKLSEKNVKVDKFPVKKFKLENLSFSELFNMVEAFNFTIGNKEYNLEDMEVINK